MDAENFSAALNGLQRYFDYNVKPLDKTNPNGLLAIHHAALGLALLHHYFGHMYGHICSKHLVLLSMVSLQGSSSYGCVRVHSSVAGS